MKCGRHPGTKIGEMFDETWGFELAGLAGYAIAESLQFLCCDVIDTCVMLNAYCYIEWDVLNQIAPSS